MQRASTLRSNLDALDDRYGAVLALASAAAEIVERLELANDSRDEFARSGFVQVPDVVSQPALEALADELWPILSPLAFPVFVGHEPAGNALSTGGRLRRVDPNSLDADGQGHALAMVLSALGVVEFGRLLAERIAPLVAHIIGAASYERMFFNLYQEGDYISAHDDKHMGQRIDVTFPVTLDGVGGLRVLSDGYLQMHYDGNGSMNILGPNVWHEVPPLLRWPRQPPPRRLTVTMRYW